MFTCSHLVIANFEPRLLASLVLLSNRKACFYTVLITILCKGLHLSGCPSMGIFSLIGLFSSYSLPFTLYSDMRAHAARDPDAQLSYDMGPSMGSNKSKPPVGMLILTSLAVATISTYFAAIYIPQSIFDALLGENATNVQVSAGCVAVFVSLLVVVLKTFYPKAAVLRSILLLISILCFLVVCDTFSSLFSLQVDPDSAFYLSISKADPDVGQKLEGINDHSGVYVLLSCFLVLAAFVGN